MLRFPTRRLACLVGSILLAGACSSTAPDLAAVPDDLAVAGDAAAIEPTVAAPTPVAISPDDPAGLVGSWGNDDGLVQVEFGSDGSVTITACGEERTGSYSATNTSLVIRDLGAFDRACPATDTTDVIGTALTFDLPDATTLVVAGQAPEGIELTRTG